LQLRLMPWLQFLGCCFHTDQTLPCLWVLEGRQEGSGNFHVADLAQAGTNVKALARDCVANMERMLQQILQVPASLYVA
jgi:hypothetical protein